MDGRCQCTNNADNLGLVTERDLNGSFFQSANGTYLQRCIICSAQVEPGKRSCSFCDYPKVLNSRFECVCPTALPADVRCSDVEPLQRISSSLRLGVSAMPYAGIPPQPPITGPVQSTAVVTISVSLALKVHLDNAVTACHDTGNPQSCNVVGNLCALQLYNGCVPCAVALSQAAQKEKIVICFLAITFGPEYMVSDIRL